jgi:hypothetical protein
MRPRSLDHSATRSGVLARRAGVVTLAAALVAAPVFATAPAYAAVGDYITAAAFPSATLSGGERIDAFFNGDSSLTSVASPGVCQTVFIDGAAVDDANYSDPTSTQLSYDSLASQYSATAGQTVTVGYFDQDSSRDDGLDSCAAPALADIAVTASVTLGEPTPPAPAPAPAIERSASAAPLTLKQGVPFDQIVTLTLDPGFDFTNGGFVSAGPQSSAGLENGELNPLEGIIFEYDQPAAGQPKLRVHGTPKYSGALTTGFEIGDGVSFATGPLVMNVADKNGFVGPISLDAAIGKPIAGSTATIIVEGLQIGSAWSATLRSTPIVIGTGAVNDAGRIAAVVTIPAGLEAGAHSITVTSTKADGTPFTTVVYFTVSASGTLLAISATSPAQLAATGTDLTFASLLAGGLLAAGLALGSTAVYRRRRDV